MNSIKQNSSPDELEKFRQFSIDWWERNGPMKSLHDINPLRMAYIENQVSLKGKRVLDVGCGGGILSETIARAGADVMGIDASSAMIAIARAHAGQSGLEIRYMNTQVEDLDPTVHGKFDLILCMELLEHVPDPLSVIRACRDLLDADGYYITATINRNFLAFSLAIVCAEYILRLLPRGTHDFKSLIKPAELEAACRSVGLSLADITGFSYNPFFKRYYLCSNSWVNYLACFRFR